MKHAHYLFLLSTGLLSLTACGRVEISDDTARAVAESCAKLGKEPDLKFDQNGATLKCKEVSSKPPMPSSAD